LASLPDPVLIHGEDGIERASVARAIHDSGGCASKPFVAVSRAALRNFDSVPAGTMFLDGIEDLPAKLQEDLLSVLQRGGLRVLAGTKTNLQQAVTEGRFREELLSRLGRIEIRIPPLRERREDIPLLAAHFVERMARELGCEVCDIAEDAVRILTDYDWPGNVRDLQNAIERAVLTCRRRELVADDFRFLTGQAAPGQQWNVPARASLQDMEKVVITATLGRTGGNIKESAGILGIDRSTLYEKIKKYGIPR
jgi:DNA-binding NtrC family response regulator